MGRRNKWSLLVDERRDNRSHRQHLREPRIAIHSFDSIVGGAYRKLIPILRPPQRLGKLQPVDLFAIEAKEVGAPNASTALQWRLLTSLPVESFAQAVEKLEWYAKRWGIEVFHRTLKSGCKIEERQLGYADRIEACLAIECRGGVANFSFMQTGPRDAGGPVYRIF